MRETDDRALRLGPAEDRQVPRGPVLDLLCPRIILLFEVQQHDMAGVAGGETGDFEIVMHQLVGLRERMILPGEELLLIVVIRPPREDRREVEMLAEDLPDHVLGFDTFGWVRVVRAYRGMNVVIARIPAVFRRIDPAVELEREFVGPVSLVGEFTRMRQVFGTARVLHGVVAGRQLDGLTVGTIDLRLEEEIGREPFGGVGIEAVQAVADLEGRRRWPAVFIFDTQRDLAGGERRKQDRDVVAEADVLRALADVEADLGGALARVAATDFEDRVFEREAGEA